MTDTQEEVKPCPLCSMALVKYPLEATLSGWVHPENEECYLEEFSVLTEDELRSWNTRPTEEALRARVEELEGALQRLSDAVCTADVEDESPLIGGAFDEACKVLNNGEKNEDT